MSLKLLNQHYGKQLAQILSETDMRVGVLIGWMDAFENALRAKGSQVILLVRVSYYTYLNREVRTSVVEINRKGPPLPFLSTSHLH